jgi:hypothetical protein
MKKKKFLKIFFGYQLRSKYHTEKKIQTTMKKLKKRIQKESNYDVEVKFGKFHPGELLFSEVLQAILDSDVAIFDVSENNANVCIEVGMAYGGNKYVICLKNRDSHKFRFPSDVNAYIYIKYDKNLTIDSNTTVDALFCAISKHYNSLSIKPEKCFHSLWGFNNNDLVYIVCPELDDPEKRQNPEPGEFLYLSKYGDIDAFLMVIKSLVKLYPQLKIIWCTGEEFEIQCENPYEQNLILIGGPDYNKITEVFMSESNFDYGIVKGKTILINKKTKKKYTPSTKSLENVVLGIDYGFFLKKINPKNKNKKLIMINGVHTYAVFGAAKCFLDETGNIAVQNCKIITKKLGEDPNFEILVEVHSENTKIDTPQIRINDILPIYNNH